MSTVCLITQLIVGKKKKQHLEKLRLRSRKESDRETGGQRGQSTNREGMEIKEKRRDVKNFSYFTAALTLWDC